MAIREEPTSVYPSELPKQGVWATGRTGLRYTGSAAVLGAPGQARAAGIPRQVLQPSAVIYAVQM